ncbi:hypothetical protein TWF730_007241 [Orbilia blumenaviensis]|uniref:Uncharacterized protein n=1 Tax=Orbilia blumenaviensis TaxID=1796055 RepID=A0AAV9V9Y1_9PEZI
MLGRQAGAIRYSYAISMIGGLTVVDDGNVKRPAPNIVDVRLGNATGLLEKTGINWFEVFEIAKLRVFEAWNSTPLQAFLTTYVSRMSSLSELCLEYVRATEYMNTLIAKLPPLRKLHLSFDGEGELPDLKALAAHKDTLEYLWLDYPRNYRRVWDRECAALTRGLADFSRLTQLALPFSLNVCPIPIESLPNLLLIRPLSYGPRHTAQSPPLVPQLILKLIGDCTPRSELLLMFGRTRQYNWVEPSFVWAAEIKEDQATGEKISTVEPIDSRNLREYSRRTEHLEMLGYYCSLYY